MAGARATARGRRPHRGSAAATMPPRWRGPTFSDLTVPTLMRVPTIAAVQDGRRAGDGARAPAAPRLGGRDNAASMARPDVLRSDGADVDEGADHRGSAGWQARGRRRAGAGRTAARRPRQCRLDGAARRSPI